MKNFLFKSKVFLKTLMTNRLFYLWAFITMAFITAEVAFGDDMVRVAAESGRIAVYAVLAAMTFVAAVTSFWSGAKQGAEQLAVAIFGIASAILIHALWIPISKYATLPEWIDPQPVTSAIIIAITLSGLGYLIPITYNRGASLPVVGTWAGVFAAGVIAGALMAVILVTGLRWF